MASPQGTLLAEVKAISPGLGVVVSSIAAARRRGVPSRVRFEQLLSKVEDQPAGQQLALQGALAILYAMGVVRLGPRRVRATSRSAAYFLGSLSKFLDKSVQAIDDPEDKLHLYSELTRIYETVRTSWDQEESVDQSPLHHCHVVNVVIKTEVTRDWRRQGAYLHVYHPDWRAYHLIGIGVDGSRRLSAERDKQLAREAIRRHLHLEPTQYEMDDTLPDVIAIDRLSETSGAYTHYTYRVLVAKDIRPRLLERNQLREGHGTFRWFTYHEMEKERSRNNEPILFSTPAVMQQLDPESLPLAAAGADDVGKPPGVIGALSSRFTRRRLLLAPAALLVLLLLWLVPRLWPDLTASNPLLDNLADLAQIVYILASFFATVLFAVFPTALDAARAR